MGTADAFARPQVVLIAVCSNRPGLLEVSSIYEDHKGLEMIIGLSIRVEHHNVRPVWTEVSTMV